MTLYSIANWGIYETGMSLAEGRKRFADCAIMGGLSNHKGPLIEGTPDEIRQEVRRVMAEAGEGCNPQDFLDEMQAELDRRMEEAAKFE